MSESIIDRSDAVGGGGTGGDDDEEVCGIHQRDDQNKRSGSWYYVRKAKRVALSRFRKVKKQLNRRNNRRFGGSGGGGGGGLVACLCFKQTPTLDSPAESQTSDPNNPEFTYELLRALMENNDFYSKECNTHLELEADSMSSSVADDK